MDDNKRSFGESARESAKIGDEHTGHGVEDVGAREGRPTTQRSERSGGETVQRTERSGGEPIQRRESVPAADVPGNTSEVGGTPPAASNDQPANRKLPSPLSRPGGCTAPTGAFLIATMSLVGATLKHKFR